MRSKKRKHYAKYKIFKYYRWPEFTELITEIYLKPFDYKHQ